MNEERKSGRLGGGVGLTLLPLLVATLLPSCSTPSTMPRTSAYALVLHGGAGSVSRANLPPAREAAVRLVLAAAVRAGESILETNGPAFEAVTAVVRLLEDSPWFNAGHGAVLNREGFCELDAAIMDGATRRAGAVAAARRIKNPILAARLVMERTPHVLLVGAGADAFAERQGLPLVEPGYFVTEPRREQLHELLERERSKPRADGRPPGGEDGIGFGTVGAVALDRQGNLAAATSTGGMVGKLPGRVGDSPLIGAGTWADNTTCAVSGTGQGEFFMRAALAHELAARLRHRQLALATAAPQVVQQELAARGGAGGLIAVDRFGNIALPFNTTGMYRAFVRAGAAPHVAIYPGDPGK